MVVGTEENAADTNEFLEMAQEQRRGLLAELGLFLWQNKNWWLLPIVAVLIALAALATLGGSGLAPLIYTVF